MKKKYTVIGQNVYVSEGNDLEVPELICIATTTDNAVEIAATLNATEKYLNEKPERKY